MTESPTYPNAIATLAHSGARSSGSTSTPRRADTEPLTATLRQVVPRVAYLIPDFHNPTGALMVDDGRADVARRARPHADDRDHRRVDGGRWRSTGSDAAPRSRRTPTDAVSVGSLSKPFWGGLRIGWIRVPAAPDGRRSSGPGSASTWARPCSSSWSRATCCATASDLLAHRREQLRASRDAALVAAVAEHLPDWRSARPPAG